MNEIHLNHSLSPYGGNNFHHLHPYPAKSGLARHHPLPHHSHSSFINLTQNMRYFNAIDDNSSSDNSNDTESDINLPLNRHHRNATSSLNSPTLTSSVAALLPVTATTTMPSLLWSTNMANRSGTVDWGKLHSTLNGTVALIDSTTPLQPPITVDDADVFLGSDAPNSHMWPTSNDIPILIGAGAGILVLLIVLIILLVIYYCCDTNNRCNGHDKNNLNNGSSDRSNRSSLSAGSCGSGSAGGNGAKRNSSSLYINNPNSLEAEPGCGSSDAVAANSGAVLVHQQPHGHYHFSNYDYGPGPGGGVAQLVIGNARVLAAVTPQADNAIPRSVSVPLSRSNSHKDSGSVSQQAQPLPSAFGANGGQPSGYYRGGTEQQRSQLSQALSRNSHLATYAESQRNKKNAKSKSGVPSDASDKSGIILNDLSLNMDMVGAPLDGQPYGNVIVNNRPAGPWVMLDPAAGEGYVQSGEQPDLEANNNGQSEFYRTRSLPWSQSSRGGGRFTSTSVVSVTAESHPDSSQTVHSGTTTMGRVNFTKKRRNRMRNDSAAAIALNRSGFLGGSLDWDFNGVERGSDGSEPLAATNKPVTLPPVATTYPNSANNQQHIHLSQDRQPTIVASVSAAVPSSQAGEGTSPDSPDYSMVTNDAIVVYNERTAL